MSSLNDPSFPGQYPAVIDQINQQLSQFPDSASSATTAQGEIVTAATIALTQIIGAAVLTDSDATTSRLASDSQVIAYCSPPAADPNIQQRRHQHDVADPDFNHLGGSAQ